MSWIHWLWQKNEATRKNLTTYVWNFAYVSHKLNCSNDKSQRSKLVFETINSKQFINCANCVKLCRSLTQLKWYFQISDLYVGLWPSKKLSFMKTTKSASDRRKLMSIALKNGSKKICVSDLSMEMQIQNAHLPKERSETRRRRRCWWRKKN